MLSLYFQSRDPTLGSAPACPKRPRLGNRTAGTQTQAAHSKARALSPAALPKVGPVQQRGRTHTATQSHRFPVTGSASPPSSSSSRDSLDTLANKGSEKSCRKETCWIKHSRTFPTHFSSWGSFCIKSLTNPLWGMLALASPRVNSELFPQEGFLGDCGPEGPLSSPFLTDWGAPPHPPDPGLGQIGTRRGTSPCTSLWAGGPARTDSICLGPFSAGKATCPGKQETALNTNQEKTLLLHCLPPPCSAGKRSVCLSLPTCPGAPVSAPPHPLWAWFLQGALWLDQRHHVPPHRPAEKVATGRSLERHRHPDRTQQAVLGGMASPGHHP